MKIEEIAKKTAISTGLDTAVIDPTVSITVWPDNAVSSICNEVIYNHGNCRLHIHISVRHDGRPEQIEAAIKRAIDILSSAQ